MTSLKVPSGQTPIFRDGYTMNSGLDETVLRNIRAVIELTEIVRTSFGPNGRNKLVVNRLEKLFVTSDAATIIRELEVVHPAAKVVVMASQQQDTEIGDRSNFVLIFAGELLRQAEGLLVLGLHASEIIQGYELARDYALSIIDELAVATLNRPWAQDDIARAVRPVIASKMYGSEDVIADLVAEAIHTVLPQDQSRFDVDSIRVVKVMGASLLQSHVIKGMVFPREPEGTTQKAANAKVAVFTSGIDVATTETKGTVLFKSSEQMLNFSQGEEAQMEHVFQELADAGVKVVVAGAQVGELALHYLNRHRICVVKVLSKFDLRRLCRVVGATPLARLGVPTPEEMGFVDSVDTVEIGGDRVTVFSQDTETTRTATIVVRGATVNQMDDVERTVDDATSAIRGLFKDARLVPGAGATELELARRTHDYGDRTAGLVQHGIKKFAEAFEVVPRTLAENAGFSTTALISSARAAHAHVAESNPLSGPHIGVDVENGALLDAPRAGILDLLAAHRFALRYAADAASSVLRVDSIIMSRPAGGPVPKQNKNWDED